MLQKLREKMKSTQRGAIMVFFAILVPLFLGMIGFAVDAGFLYMQKAKLQDIADAAALAGAGHLNDGDDGSKTRLAVRKFAEENGIAGTATSEVFIYDENYPVNNNINLGSSDKLKLAMKVERNVMDKDNVQRDHVRVAIAKRVPTFFIRLLFPDEKEVIVRSVAVAEYVKGEQVVSYGGPKIITGPFLHNYYVDGNSFDIANGSNFSIYTNTQFGEGDFNKLPKTNSGTLYAPHWTTQKPEGWTIVRTTKTEWNLDDPQEKAEKEALDAANEYVETKSVEYKTQADDFVNNRSSYMNRVENKRYIGYDMNGNMINNIEKGDDNIELYMDGTYSTINDQWGDRGYRVILTNNQLRGATHIKTLVFGHHIGASDAAKTCIISTENVYYGNIYNTSVSNGLSISGSYNHFNGLIYSPSTLLIGGIGNRYNETNNTQLFVFYKKSQWEYNGQIEIGHWNKVISSVNTSGEEKLTIEYNHNESNNSSWKFYWGGNGSGSSSGSSGSDTTSKSRVRLVI